MNATVLAIPAALLAATTLFSPPAQACISCDYVPPVVYSGVSPYAGGYYAVRPYRYVHVRRGYRGYAHRRHRRY